MEKSFFKTNSELKTVVVTGPESTGKTAISSFLSDNLKCPWIPEYAREYISQLNRPYVFDDLLNIFETQLKLKKDFEEKASSILILDTWLIITKIWFTEVFNKYPDSIDRELKTNPIDLYLVCMPDIPWIPDPLRENGGEKRNYLLEKYLQEIKNTGSPYIPILGTGNERFKNALDAVKIHFNL